MKPIVNWDVLVTLNRPLMSGDPSAHNWDDSADLYNIMAQMERSYTYNQLNCFDVAPQDTVLDIGCGPGRISCAISEKAKSVTALDAFPKMLEYCKKNAAERSLTNINPHLLNWHDAELGKNIEQHDIVIASRSVGMHDIYKLNAFAKKYAVIICWANAPSIPPILNELFAGCHPDRKAFGNGGGILSDRRAGYNATWNMVYDMGADPNINIVTDGFTKTFLNYDEAYAYLRQILPFEEEYLPRFKKNLTPYLTEEPNGHVTFRRETKSYVLWWKPVQLENT